jgi:3-deoxy-D-manno-octulosonic-acid transferase
MKFLYYLLLELSTRILPILGIFVPKIGYFLSRRASLMPQLAEFRQSHPGRLAWFHVASLGEYEQARPVIAELKATEPSLLVVVSFFSPSGYEHLRTRPQPGVDFISYLPLDRKAWAEQFVGILDPSIAFFVKYDLWYHHLAALKKRQIPTFLLAASFRSEQPYFAWYGGFFRSMLAQMDWIFTQNNESLTLLKGIQLTKASQAGDTRFDRVAATAAAPKALPELRAWINDRATVVVGSAWEEDMALLIPLIQAKPDYLWIIAPHDLNASVMSRWARQLQLPSAKYSDWTPQSEATVLFVDNMGMLSSLYQFAQVAYVGGGFGKGLHNILEPLGFGVPVLFGKVRRQSKFPEASQSQAEGCGVEVSNFDELRAAMDRLAQPEAYAKATDVAETWVKANLGAAQRIVAHLKTAKLLK